MSNALDEDEQQQICAPIGWAGRSCEFNEGQTISAYLKAAGFRFGPAAAFRYALIVCPSLNSQ